ncbi:disease resistance protein TAO1-like [Rosa chinensis]|uniref:disease resistance protein TAO1-like n=1 Tax=Rosa chinensis TaxID=74649 RepID=UPI000D08E02C|nr:disease resistance protein TAO1-like [Rosa chinensis]
MPGNLESLSLHCTAIEELPSSTWCLKKLHVLDLVECKELKNLPSSTCRLNSLRLLHLKDYLSLECLPVELPSGLEHLELSSCESLGSLPVELPSGLNLRSLPVQLPSGLKYLSLSNCKSLGSLPVELPSGLKYLILRNCKSLGSLPVKLPSGLNELNLSNCESLRSLPVELPSVLEKLHLSNCKSLGSLQKLPWLLNDLQADGCMSLEKTAPKPQTLPEKNPCDLPTVRVKRCGVSLLFAQDLENLVGGIDEDVVMEPKQVVEKEDIIINTKRQRDQFEPGGSGTATSSLKKITANYLPTVVKGKSTSSEIASE